MGLKGSAEALGIYHNSTYCCESKLSGQCCISDGSFFTYISFHWESVRM